MSIQLGLANLETAVRERGAAARVLTVYDGGSPHVVQAETRWRRAGCSRWSELWQATKVGATAAGRWSGQVEARARMARGAMRAGPSARGRLTVILQA